MTSQPAIGKSTNETLRTDDFTTLLHEHQELSRILNALAKLSIMQSTPLHEDEWQQVLERKALLLDEIDSRHIDVLSKRTNAFVDAVHTHDERVDVCQLKALAEENWKRLDEIYLTEMAAQQILKYQIDDLKQLLTKVGNGRRARRVYKGTMVHQKNEPRFINGTR